MPLKTAILCRTNAPLVKCAFDLIRRGRGIKIKLIGKDIAKMLKDVIGEVLDFRLNAPIKEFMVLLDGWMNHVREMCQDDDSKESFLTECEDHYACLLAISSQANDVKELCQVIDNYFCDSDDIGDDPMTVVFASGHRSKGLEWERVFWIRPDLCPHPSSKTPADKKQEDHLLYILATRTQRELYICKDKLPL